MLTATSPLAPSPTPGWLEVLVQVPAFWRLSQYPDGFVASTEFRPKLYESTNKHPTHAVARALIAADPALRAACEACEDWGNYKEIVK